MKHLMVFIIVYTSVAHLANAQIIQGKITFMRRVDVHRSLPEEHQQYKGAIPQFSFAQFELLFSNEHSLFRQPIMDTDDTEQIQGNIAMRPVGAGSGLPDDRVYMQFKENRLIEQRELMKRYIIHDSLNRVTWRLTDSTKTILGYHCNQAIASVDDKKIKAWYTTLIPIPAGPLNYGALPGMILLLDEDDGHIQFIAKEISKEVNLKEIKAPTGGKTISRDELKKMMSKISQVIR